MTEIRTLLDDITGYRVRYAILSGDAVIIDSQSYDVTNPKPYPMAVLEALSENAARRVGQ